MTLSVVVPSYRRPDALAHSISGPGDRMASLPVTPSVQ